MRRLMLTSTAQALLAASTALQALLLLHGDDATAFGQFALSMLWLTLALGVQQALIGAPMLIRKHHAQRLLLRLADWLALLLCLAALLLLLCWQLAWQLALLIALSQFGLLRRAARRQLQHQQGAFRLAALQDSAFALVQISGCLLLWWAGALQLPALVMLNLSAVLLQELLVVFRPMRAQAAYTSAKRVPQTSALYTQTLQTQAPQTQTPQTQALQAPAMQPKDGALITAGRITRQRLWLTARACYLRQGRAALRGVFYVELLANGALYLLGFWHGPAAVAPLSAAALLWRPAAVVLAGMSQRWRPELRQRVLTGQPLAMLMREVRQVSLGLLLLNALAALLVLLWVPNLIWPAGMSGGFIMICMLTALLSALRGWRQADVMRLQALDKFAALANAQQSPALLAMLLAALWIALAPLSSGGFLPGLSATFFSAELLPAAIAAMLLPAVLLPGLLAEIWLCWRLSQCFPAPEQQ